MMSIRKAFWFFIPVSLVVLILAAGLTGCASSKVSQKQPATPVPTGSDGSNSIGAIILSADADATRITISAESPLTYTAVKQVSPPAVVLYFPSTLLGGNFKKEPESLNSGVVKGINATVLKEKVATVRLEILLEQDTPYQVERSGSELAVVFTGADSGGFAAGDAPGASVKTAQAPTSGMAKTTLLEEVVAKTGGGGVDIFVAANGSINDYKSFAIKDPERIVFDLYNVQSKTDKEQVVTVNSELVRQIRHYGYPDRVRIVLDTNGVDLADIKSSPDAGGLHIRVGSGKIAATKEESADKNTATASTKAIVSPAGPSWVNRIDFSSEDAGKSTIIIGTTVPVHYEAKTATDKRLQIELSDTRLPDYHRRPLITTRFESAVDRITPIQHPKNKNVALISVELREAVPYFVEQAGNLIMVHFEASSIPPQPVDKANLPAWQQVMEETIAVDDTPMILQTADTGQESSDADMPADTGADSVAAPEEGGAEEPVSLGAKKEYTGEKIALDFFQTDIKNVFRILREISGKNFAVDKEVSGEVTLSLDKPVPWDQVLDLILRMNGLTQVMEGDIVRITTQERRNSEIAIERQQLAALKENLKVKMEQEDLVTEYISVNYANAQADVLPHIVTTPERPGVSVTVDPRNNQIIITDTADRVRMARETVERIDKVTPQVMIEARIVEATKTFSRTVGTQWGVDGGPIFNTEGLGGLIPEGAIEFNMASTNPPTSALGSIGVSFTKLEGWPFSLLNAQLQASESEGIVKIISAPKILTLDNKQALIRQGVSYPLTHLDADGNTVTEFQDVALELQVTPHVTPDNRISMQISITNNEIGAVINNETSFTTKEAQTELLVNDGDTVIIGGIRKTRKDDGGAGVPGLKDVPFVGWLFKSENKSEDLEELLIFITPKIVLLEQRTR